MIIISTLNLIVAQALTTHFINLSLIFARISAITFIFAGVLSFNTLYIQSIGSGEGIYRGIFNITQLSAFMELFILVMATSIFIAYPSNIINNILKNSNIAGKRATHFLVILFNALGILLLISKSLFDSNSFAVVSPWSCLLSCLILTDSELISILFTMLNNIIQGFSLVFLALAFLFNSLLARSIFSYLLYPQWIISVNNSALNCVIYTWLSPQAWYDTLNSVLLIVLFSVLFSVLLINLFTVLVSLAISLVISLVVSNPSLTLNSWRTITYAFYLIQ